MIFYWYIVVYPQCGWLLFIKLYHNELIQSINVLSQFNNNTNINTNNCHVLKCKINKYANRLFLYQLSVRIASIYAAVCYLYCIVIRLFAYVLRSVEKP